MSATDIRNRLLALNTDELKDFWNKNHINLYLEYDNRSDNDDNVTRLIYKVYLQQRVMNYLKQCLDTFDQSR